LSGLSFFHPEFFWALAALCVPLVIHLLNRRPPRRLEFSTVRFFSAGAVRKSKVRALKRLLLLLVRLGIILSVVAIFLQPFNRHDPFASLWNPDAAVYAFVDPTISMDYRNHDGPLWREAFAVLDSLDRMLSPSAKRWFYDDARRAFVFRRAFPVPPRVFSRHGPSGSSRMMAAFDEAANGHGRGVPILIALSDFQVSESRAFDTAFTRRARAPVACVSVAPKDAWDYRVSDVRISDENNSTVTARISCVGRDLRAASLSATMGGMRAGHASVSLDRGKQADVSIPVTADASGQPAGTVRCEVDDPFPLDNTGFFVRGPSRAVRVLIAGDAYESFPLAAAFESLGPAQWIVTAKKENEVTYGDIDSASLIVLCGVRRLSPPLDLLVHGRSFGPKAVLFSPVTDSAGAYVNNTLLSAVRRQPLSLIIDTIPHSPVLPDTLSSLFAGFPRLRDADARVYRYCDGLPGAVAVRLDNGRPLLTLLDDTLGNSWIMAATSLGLAPRGQTAANNLSETGLFVALLDRMCRHALSAIHREPHTWTAGCAARNPYLGSKGGALVFDLQNRLVATWLRQPSVVFDEPGCYRIQPLGEQAYWVAVQLDSSETSLSYRFPEAGKDNADMVRCMTADRFLDFVKSSRHGAFPLWLWVCLGLLLVAEVLLWERALPPAAAVHT
jgi:Aerotolerance regulator N-terminal